MKSFLEKKKASFFRAKQVVLIESMPKDLSVLRMIWRLENHILHQWVLMKAWVVSQAFNSIF